MKRTLNNQFEFNNALITESNLIDCISNTFITSGSGGSGDFTNILNTNLSSGNSKIVVATIGNLNITGDLNSSNILSNQITASNILNTNLTTGTIVTTNLIANGTAYISNIENTNLITTSSISSNRGTISNLNNTSLTSSNIYVSDQISYIANASNPNSYQIKLSGNDIRMIGAEDQSTVRNFVFGSFSANNSANTWFPTATIQTCSRGNVSITNNLSAGSLSSLSGTVSNIVSTNISTGALITNNNTLQSLFVSGNSVLNGFNTFGGLLVTGNSILIGTTTTGTLRASSITTSAGGSITTQVLTVGPGTSSLSAVTATGISATNITSNSGYTGGSLNITGGSTLNNTTISNLSLGNNGIFNEVSKTYTNNATTLMATFGSTVFRGVEILASNRIITSTNPRTAIYTVYGYYDNNSWSISESRVGNNYGTFSITSSGNLSFTSTNEADFISGTMKFRQTFISI